MDVGERLMLSIMDQEAGVVHYARFKGYMLSYETFPVSRGSHCPRSMCSSGR